MLSQVQEIAPLRGTKAYDYRVDVVQLDRGTMAHARDFNSSKAYR